MYHIGTKSLRLVADEPGSSHEATEKSFLENHSYSTAGLHEAADVSPPFALMSSEQQNLQASNVPGH